MYFDHRRRQAVAAMFKLSSTQVALLRQRWRTRTSRSRQAYNSSSRACYIPRFLRAEEAAKGEDNILPCKDAWQHETLSNRNRPVPKFFRCWCWGPRLTGKHGQTRQTRVGVADGEWTRRSEKWLRDVSDEYDGKQISSDLCTSLQSIGVYLLLLTFGASRTFAPWHLASSKGR